MADASNTPEEPVTEELALITRGKDITRGFVDGLELLQPQDSVLIGRGGGDYKIYEDLLRDDQVHATFQQRRMAVVSREYGVDAGGKSALDQRAADFIKEVLQHIKFDRATNKMLYGVFYGFAVAECLWSRDGALVMLDQVKVRKQRRFRFSIDGSLRLLTMAKPQGEVLPERKFWAYSCGADNDDDPYGLGLAHFLYWLVFFKRNGLKFWLIFLEKYGVPTALAQWPRNAKPEEKQKLLAAASAIQTDAAVGIPADTMIKLIEAQRSGNIDQRTFHQVMDAAIAKIVLSQTMTTDDGASRSQAEVHNSVRKEVVKSDADLICESFNEGPVRWLTEWNFPGAAPPKVWRKLEDAPDSSKLADRDKKISEMGFEPSERYVNETYGGEWRRKSSASVPAPQTERPASFAENDGPGAATVMADRLEAEVGEPFTGLLEPVQKLVERATSFEEIRNGILELYTQMPTGPLGNLIERALKAAELAGRFDADPRDE